MSLIPLSGAVKAKVDVPVIGVGALSFFKAIPWPEIAGALAALYTLLRIAELVWGWIKGRRNSP